MAMCMWIPSIFNGMPYYTLLPRDWLFSGSELSCAAVPSWRGPGYGDAGIGGSLVQLARIPSGLSGYRRGAGALRRLGQRDVGWLPW